MVLDDFNAKITIPTKPFMISIRKSRESFEVIVGLFSIEIDEKGSADDIRLLAYRAALEPG